MGAEETWPRPSSEREGNIYHLPVLVCFVRPLQGKAKKIAKVVELQPPNAGVVGAS